FDLVRTSYWAASVPKKEDRPWNGTLDPITAMNTNTVAIDKQFNDVLDRIVATPSAQALLSMLRNLSVDGKQTTVTYVVGNHDRVFNNFPSLQTKVRNLLPSINLTFKNAFKDSTYSVLARHGHEWDEVCHGLRFANEVMNPNRSLQRFDDATYKVMAIGEAITAELMAGFIYTIETVFTKKGWTSPEDLQFLRGLRDINNLRPMTAIFIWLRWFTRNQKPQYLPPLTDALIEALNTLLETTLAQRWDDLDKPILPGYIWGDITDQFEAARNDLVDGGLEKIEQTMEILLQAKKIVDFFKKQKDDLVEGAKEEFKSFAQHDGIQHVVYGHTHEARHDFFSGDLGGSVQMYINTGTYLPFIQLCLEEKNFATAHRMTMAFFYNNNEDVSNRKGNGPTVEIWNGVRRKFYK
ncbi:MAG: hypothetical protein HY277_06850, partial [Ignavibacteriales bacterium]|nr:hypothetical protein [Ignavibacteriales bacterium]